MVKIDDVTKQGAWAIRKEAITTKQVLNPAFQVRNKVRKHGRLQVNLLRLDHDFRFVFGPLAVRWAHFQTRHG